ncbi:hypothetical protein B0T19DRAFT_265819 [Cercophora scortea]|uniref:Uncharacterized protein n=1 Tax=Cercophora scortea TaxID=314031 RepID=A0AAE0IAF4_9PEZI|nr:hypothetical protein B0T19DRAFT_265819 [Cercophora scortea]
MKNKKKRGVDIFVIWAFVCSTWSTPFHSLHGWLDDWAVRVFLGGNVGAEAEAEAGVGKRASERVIWFWIGSSICVLSTHWC